MVHINLCMLFTIRKIKRRKAAFVLVLSLILVSFYFRNGLLKSIGDVLIAEDQLKKSDAIAILGGNSFDRATRASELYHEGWSERVICTGGNSPLVLEAIGNKMYEAEVSESVLLQNGVPRSAITNLTSSTSTFEEAQELLKHCQENNVGQLIVVSSLFHLTRVQMIFSKVFDSSETQLVFAGAESSKYDEQNWWKSEAGMIMVNNEYVKLVYYLIKY